MAEKKSEKKKKIFVLDTSVILYNHNAINNFEDNDVAIPITVLEELDNFKKGNDTKNFEAREFIRFLDSISGKLTMTNWRRLDGPEKGKFRVIMNEQSRRDARHIFGEDKADHRILNAALKLKEDHPERKVVLVSKDINLRLKAKAMNLPAEDFETGKIKNISTLYTGKDTLSGVPGEIIDSLYANGFCTACHYGSRSETGDITGCCRNRKNPAGIHPWPKHLQCDFYRG